MKKTKPNPIAQKAAMERNLIEIDRVISAAEQERAGMIAAHRTVAELETVCQFLQTLRGRREIILHELRKAGGSEAGAYHRKEEIERELDIGMVKTAL